MRRSLWSATSLRSTMIMTMVVVMLSSMALRKKAMNEIFHSRARFDSVCNALRTKLKPPFWSTISTMVIAPIRKNSVVDVLPRWASMMELTLPRISAAAVPGR